MGVVQREDVLYLRVSCGVMKNKKKNIEASAYEGVMVGIREKTGEFEGKPTVAIELKMRDPKNGEIAIIQWTKEGWYSLGFFSRIKKIDITKQFTVGVMRAEDNEKMSFCYLKQQGIEKVEADKSFPKYEKVTVSGKQVLDYTKPFAEMDAIVKYLTDQIAKINPPAALASASVEEVVLSNGNVDDLPF